MSSSELISCDINGGLIKINKFLEIQLNVMHTENSVLCIIILDKDK
jgi:hypothetical protein